MGLAEIESRIMVEAQAEAEKIKNRAEEEASRIEAEAKNKAEAIRQKILAEAGIKAGEEKLAILVPARLTAKKKLLEEKHRVIDSVFSGFPAEIREKKESEVIKLLYG